MSAAASASASPVAPPSPEALARAQRSQAAWLDETPCRPLLHDLTTRMEQQGTPATPEGAQLLADAQAALDHSRRDQVSDERACLKILRALHAAILAKQGRVYVPPFAPDPFPTFRHTEDAALFNRLDTLIRLIDRAEMQAEARRKQQQQRKRR